MMSGLQPALCHLAFLSAGQLPYGLLLSLLPERDGPLPAPSFASSEEGRCLASSDGCGWGGKQQWGCRMEDPLHLLEEMQRARLEISAPWSGGGGQKGAIITLCFSLNTAVDLATSSRACVGHWWQVRVSKRGDRDCFTPNHTSPNLCVSLSKRHRHDALIPCHSLKGTGCADT